MSAAEFAGLGMVVLGLIFYAVALVMTVFNPDRIKAGRESDILEAIMKFVQAMAEQKPSFVLFGFGTILLIFGSILLAGGAAGTSAEA